MDLASVETESSVAVMSSSCNVGYGLVIVVLSVGFHPFPSSIHSCTPPPFPLVWCAGVWAFIPMPVDMSQSTGCHCRSPELVSVSNLSGIDETTSGVEQYGTSAIRFIFWRKQWLCMVTRLLSTIHTRFSLLPSTSPTYTVFTHRCG